MKSTILVLCALVGNVAGAQSRGFTASGSSPDSYGEAEMWAEYNAAGKCNGKAVRITEWREWEKIHYFAYISEANFICSFDDGPNAGTSVRSDKTQE